MNNEAKYTEQQKYQIFNFHPIKTIDTIKAWLHADSSKPLVLTGEAQIGRSYVLEAACFQETHHDLPYLVIHLDNATLNGDIKKIARFIEDDHTIKKQDAKQWHSLVDKMADIADIEIPALYGFAVTLKLTAAFNLVRTIATLFQDKEVKLPETDARTVIENTIELAAKQYNLIFHLQNAEAEPHILSFWQDITQTLDLVSLQEDSDTPQATKQGRVLLAVSMQPNAPYAGAMGQEKHAIEFIELNPYNEQDLKEVLDERFKNNHFSDDFIRLLLWQGKLDDNDIKVFASQLVHPMVKLFNESILQNTENGWIIDEPTDARLNNILGAPLRVFLRERQATIPAALKTRVDEFMQLAALCGSWIPQQPLLEAMGIENREDKDDILDAIESAFVECQPSLMQNHAYRHPATDKVAVYSSLYPILHLQYTKHWSVEERQQKAKALLQQLSGIYPMANSTFASLYWNIASYADITTQQEWRVKLQWYVNYLTAPYFKQWLQARLQSGLIKPEQLMNQAAKREISPTAKVYLDAVMEVCDHYYATRGGYPSTVAMAVSLTKTGSAYRNLGDYQQVLDYLQQALAIAEAVLPEQHPDLASFLNNVGLIYWGLGDYQQALDYLQQALAIDKAVLPEQHPNLAQSLNNIGLTYGGLGNHKKALDYQQQALAIRKAVLPEQHSDLASSLNNVGIAYGNLGDYQQALDYQQQALAINKAMLPEQHPVLASSLNNIGSAYWHLGDYQQALDYQQQALAIDKAVLPEQHPDLALSLSNIGSTYGDLSNHKKALDYKQQALAIRKAVLPKQHPDIVNSHYSIGRTYLKQQAFKKAKKHTKKAMKLIKQSASGTHPDEKHISNQLADIYEAMGKPEKAAKYRVL